MTSKKCMNCNKWIVKDHAEISPGKFIHKDSCPIINSPEDHKVLNQKIKHDKTMVDSTINYIQNETLKSDDLEKVKKLDEVRDTTVIKAERRLSETKANLTAEFNEKANNNVNRDELTEKSRLDAIKRTQEKEEAEKSSREAEMVKHSERDRSNAVSNIENERERITQTILSTVHLNSCNQYV